MDGKLAYIALNDLEDDIVVKHRVDGYANNNGTPLNGAQNYEHMGVTSLGAGADFDFDWILSELERGEDVELDLFYQGPGNGRHYVEVVGAGYSGGKPFLLHVSDLAQADIDPTDTLGTDGPPWRDYITINNDGDGFAEESNAIIDQIVTQSYVPDTPAVSAWGMLAIALLLVTAMTIKFAWRKANKAA